DDDTAVRLVRYGRETFERGLQTGDEIRGGRRFGNGDPLARAAADERHFAVGDAPAGIVRLNAVTLRQRRDHRAALAVAGDDAREREPRSFRDDEACRARRATEASG